MWPLLVVHVALLVCFDLARRPSMTMVLLALAFASFLWAARRLETAAAAPAILLVAAALRLLLLPLPPTLSDDLLRYAWDGKVTRAGQNPYLLAPDASELAPLRDDAWTKMPHKEVPTVYPPLAQTLFAVAAWTPYPRLTIKILLTLADLVGCGLLIALARRRGLPAGRAVWYCWNPLVVLETAGMGHVDALVAAALVATVLLLGRPAAAGAAAAAGVLAKLIPLVALPMWARHSGGAARFLAAALGLSILFLAPVAVSVAGVPPGLVTYGISWEWNGPLYEPLWRGLDLLALDQTVKDWLDEAKQRTGRHEFWNRFYPYVYPQLMAKLLLAAGFAVCWLRSFGERDPVIGSGRLFGAFILCSSTVYPWYLLWVLPWAALARHRAWLALSALLPLSYWPQLVGSDVFPETYLVIWLPFFVLLGRTRWTTG